ncbi:thioredoxin [Xylanibacillus composti]|uniref:Thiol reductase thioredoxin n=1 Tax=Xylanibacillus composti TaxID=1572762 RepID=A0A8J4H8V8_9BACL|nr:thioredoxin family protein [Xylanibacillus composti]MDT9724996.1 thioredoxin [Xylanibacillus composti]GIQ71289.1 thiol reductase thioredoxin [Xylanibacillus composti]
MKKLWIYLLIIVVLFGALFFINQMSKNRYAEDAQRLYGVSPDKLSQPTLEQLKDPNYQNIITEEALSQKLANQETLFVYFFQPTCVHCQITTPILMPMMDELGIDIQQYNLSEYPGGWEKYGVTATPTIVYFEDGVAKDMLTGEISDAEHTISPDEAKSWFQQHQNQ